METLQKLACPLLLRCCSSLLLLPLLLLSVAAEPPEPQDVLCATSLVFWSITLVVLVKYVAIMLLADDNGEGEVPDPFTHHCW
jgi:K+ transporter